MAPGVGRKFVNCQGIEKYLSDKKFKVIMAIRIMHTADNHIGLEFRNQPEIRDSLVQERFEALERIVAEANARNCDFLVVAGDLFDNLKVAVTSIDKVVEILKKFNANVIVLPGNHDFHGDDVPPLWKHFTDKITGSQITLLSKSGKHEYILHDRKLIFYGCPCHSKHAPGHVIGWVKDVPKDPEDLHIGVAHGNVEGLGLDDEGRYFHMTREDLRQSGTDLWLLGHIHKPSPAPGYVGNDLHFMCGSSAPEHIKRDTVGNAWYIEVDEAKKVKFEPFRSGRIHFKRIQQQLMSDDDISVFMEQWERQADADMVIEMRLTGHLTDEQRIRLQEWISGIREKYLHLILEQDIIRRIRPEDISRDFEDGSFQHQLLTKLSVDISDERALQMAYDIIKEIER
jgi:DNA repair exonuclease SbcCD nuclease subunit